MNQRYGDVPRPALPLLAFMMSAGPFGDTEYTPAMPAMAHALGTSYGMVQFTMAAYLAGSAVSQLVYGPLSDRHGRRRVMLVGATILLVGAFVCLLSFSIWPLLAGRVVQGVGACAGGVIADATVRDAFPADRREKVYAKLNAAFALAPAIGPVVGTFAAHAFGWHANFAILAAVALALWVLTWRYLPETNLRRNPHALEVASLWGNYLRTLQTREFTVFAVVGGCCVGVVYAALIGAPDLVINVLGLHSMAFIIVAGSILAAFVLGAGSCVFLSRHLPAGLMIAIGMGVLLAGSVALLAVAMLVGKHGALPTYLVPIAVCFVGIGLVVPESTALAMAPFKDTAGSAASLLGFLRMGVATIATGAMSVLHAGSVYDMPFVFLALSIIGAIALFATHSARRRSAAVRA